MEKGRSRREHPWDPVLRAWVTPGAWGTFVPRKSPNMGGDMEQAQTFCCPLPDLPPMRKSPSEGSEGPGVTLFQVSQLRGS